MQSFKWACVKRDAATGLKIVGTGLGCRGYYSISSALEFEDVWVRRLWAPGGLVLEFSLIVSFNDGKKGFYWCEILTAGRQFSTRTLALWSHPVMAAACVQHYPAEICRLDWSMWFSKIFIYISAFKIYFETLPACYIHTRLQEIQAFELNAHSIVEGLSHSETVHFRGFLSHRTQSCFWTMFKYGVRFAWWSFSCVCRCLRRLGLLSVSVSIPWLNY